MRHQDCEHCHCKTSSEAGIPHKECCMCGHRTTKFNLQPSIQREEEMIKKWPFDYRRKFRVVD